MTNTTNTTAKKVTKREYFNQLLAIKDVAANDSLVNFIMHEIELLDKKSSKSGGQTKTQKENESIKVEILNALNEVDKPVTVSELMTVGVIKERGYNNQKLTALLRQLTLDNKVVRTVDKKKAYYSVA